MPTPSVFSNGANVTPLPGDRENELYGGDPTAAMMAVMRQMGINPFITNPFVQHLLQTAPGLRNAWNLSNIGAKQNDIEANGGVGQMFGDFLRGQLQGGNVSGTLAQARNNLPNYTNQIRGMYDQITQPGMLDSLPPFLKELDEALNNPSQFANLYGSLASPSLGGLGDSYQKAVRANVFSQAQNRLLPPGAQGGQTDLISGPTFLEWIMGKR